MTEPREQTVVGLGELLWDCFPDGRVPGGAPANVAFHLGQLGHRAVIASRVGDDADGRGLIEFVASRGLDTEFLQVDPHRATGRVTVDNRDPSNPAYRIHENAAWDALEFTEELAALCADAAALCVGSLAQREAVSRKTIGHCLAAAEAAGSLVVFDVNLRQRSYDRPCIEDTLRRADVVKLNLDEVRRLDRLLELGRPEPRGFARRVIDDYEVDWVCVTRADAGCLLLGGAGEIHDLPGRAVEVVDAVGAGDAFTAMLVSGRLRGWPLETCGRAANEVGALVATRNGATPALGEELCRLLGRYGAAG